MNRKIHSAPKHGTLPKAKVRKAIKAIKTKVHTPSKSVYKRLKMQQADLFEGVIFKDWFEQQLEEGKK